MGRMARLSDIESDPRIALARLADALAEDLMGTTDEELRAELGDARVAALAGRTDAAIARAMAAAAERRAGKAGGDGAELPALGAAPSPSPPLTNYPRRHPGRRRGSAGEPGPRVQPELPPSWMKALHLHGHWIPDRTCGASRMT
jgi:hypothetical protein